VKALFDPQIFSLQSVGGISRYFFELARAMNRSNPETARIFAPWHANQYLADCEDELFAGGRHSAVQGAAFGAAGWYMLTTANLYRLKRHLGGNDYDVLHHTYYWPVTLRGYRGSTVTTVHDMIDEVFGRGGLRSRLKRRAVATADHVICVSHNTRRDLIKYFGTPEEKTSVVYLGRPAAPRGQRQSRVVGTRPFALFVGHRGGYKNFLSLVHALGASVCLKRDIDLVCFGGGEFTTQETAAVKAAGLEGRVSQRNGDDRDLCGLYGDATLMVYPSLYEGFGLPPLEAMAYGTPVACSNVSSIPEIVGDAAELFDPEDTDSIRSAIERVVYSRDRSRELVERGNARVGRFSWEQCASETFEVYRRAC
jgi:glycosyltransferase involved in cell wall biosynthesis